MESAVTVLPGTTPHEPCVDAVLPLAWRPDTGGGSVHSGIADGSALTLQSLLSAGESPHKETAEDGAEVVKEIARLDAKLNLLLELVGDLLVSIQPLPGPVPVHLTARAVSWVTRDPSPPGTRGEVHVYLNPELPRPVCLPGTVRETLPSPDGTRMVVEFDPMPAGLDDLLEKFVFQWHRRQVADRRRGRSNSGS